MSNQENTTSFDTNFEILNGKVKQLSVISRDYENRPDTLITYFDVHGNATHAKRKGTCNCLGKYEYKYDKKGKKTEVILKNDARLFPFQYKYDTTGRIVELTVGTKELSDYPPYSAKLDKGFYKYDSSGDRIEDDEYRLDGEDCWVIKYKYDNRHLLLSSGLLNGAEKLLEIETRYKYLSFDSKGNWVKREVNIQNYPPLSKDTRHYIETRKISYY